MSTAAKAEKKRLISLNTRNTLVGLSFILPNFIGFTVFILVPVIFSFVLSVMNWDGFTAMEFVGLQNFVNIFKDRVFRAALRQTIVFSVFTVIFSMIAALGLALLLNTKIKFVNFFRSAIFFPYVASIVAVGAVFKAMFLKDGGPINQFLSMIGVPAELLPGWLSSTKWALMAVIIVQVWKNMGYFMLIYLAALQDIPSSLYEAASIVRLYPAGLQGWFRLGTGTGMGRVRHGPCLPPHPRAGVYRAVLRHHRLLCPAPAGRPHPLLGSDLYGRRRTP